MNVILIKPTVHTDAITPPLGLGYLATSVRNRHNVRIVDGPLVNLNPRKLGRILEENQPDVVGFQLLTMDLVPAWRYLSIVKEILPDAITVVGGPQASCEPEGTMHWFGSGLDYGFVGEAEEGFSRLLDALEGKSGRNIDRILAKDIPGLIWRDGLQVRVNDVRHENDLDSLGFPAWDLIHPQLYPPAPHAAFAKAFPVGCITATRGCPYNCDFCGAGIIHGKKLRARSVGHVIEEIGLLVNRYGMREIHLIDDNFTFNKNYALDFCEQKAIRFPNIPWTCPNGVRLDSLDPELLKAMKRSGCHYLAIGIESGSQHILDAAQKKQKIETIREKVALIRGAGMDTVGFFIFGFPGETIADMNETARLSLELPLTRAHYMFYHPIPGTESYRRVLRKCPECLRKIESSFERVAYVENGLTEKLLKNLQRAAFMRFYLRKYQFSSLLTGIRHPMQIYYFLRRIIRWMIFN